MRYTPVELRHLRIGSSVFGYTRDEVDRILEDVADSFEDVWRDRGELTDRLEEVEKQLAEHKQRETLLANTLISAERAASDAKHLAQREAEVIAAEAHQEARSIVRTAQAERQRLFTEARRVEALLRSALGVFEEPRAAGVDLDRGLSSDIWPRREETREFEAVELPPPVADETDEPARLSLAVEEEEAPEAGRDFVWG
jgi:cell division initiation protein